MTYIAAAHQALAAHLDPADKRFDLYLLLTLVKGSHVTLKDVHDAWAIAEHHTNPTHPSIVPFHQLTPDVQALDQPYADAITAARMELT